MAYYAAFFTIRAKAFKLSAMIHGLEGQRQAMKDIMAKGKSATKIDMDLYSSLELRGYSFMNVDISRSDATRFTICEGKILPPFTAIDGLGVSVAEQIVSARNDAPFSSKADLKIRGKVPQPALELMAEEGCLGDLPEDEQIDLFAM